MDFDDIFISSGNIRLDAQLKFTAEIDKMTSVLRRTLLIDRSRRENDAEHSWHISVMALIFAEYATEKVNVLHAVEMMLVHDLVEIYAGDTFAYDVKGYENKAQRENEAADRLFSILPEEQGKYIRQLWLEFDAVQSRLPMPSTPTALTGCNRFFTTCSPVDIPGTMPTSRPTAASSVNVWPSSANSCRKSAPGWKRISMMLSPGNGCNPETYSCSKKSLR